MNNINNNINSVKLLFYLDNINTKQTYLIILKFNLIINVLATYFTSD